MAYKPKTLPNKSSVKEFLEAKTTGQKLQDCLNLVDLMEKITGKNATMWGDSIIGFGKYHYVYQTGHEGDSAIVGFSPRKSNITIYITSGFGQYMDQSGNVKELMTKLGKYKTGKVCLYINQLSDININILAELINRCVAYMKENYQTNLV